MVLDFIGAAYLQRNLQSLKPWGTLSVVGVQGISSSFSESPLVPLVWEKCTPWSMLFSLLLPLPLFIAGLMGGRSAELDLGLLLRKKLTVCGAVLRSRSPDEKAEAVQRFQTRWLPLLEQGIVSPLIDSTFVVCWKGSGMRQ